MNLSVKTIITAGFALATSAQALFAQISNAVVTIDEFGVGTLNGNPLPSFTGPDPSGGVTTSPVLIYTLPFPVTQGDVILSSTNEPPNSPNWPVSDVVRFWNSSGLNQGQIIFYSDVSPTDPANAPADVGIPSQILPSNNLVFETGPESGPNGAVYIANVPGQPGALAGVSSVQYNIISDPVPEPGSTALLLTGLGGFFAIHRQVRRRWCGNRS